MIKKVLVSAMTAMLLLTSGCEQPPQPVDPPAENPKSEVDKPVAQKPAEKPIEKPQVDKPVKIAESKVKTMQVTVYYPDEAGMNLVPVKREIKITDDKEKYLAAVNCLLEEPAEEDLTKIFPKGAKILSVDVDKNTAVVNIDSGITKNFIGGSTGEEFLVQSVVDTLTEFKEVKEVYFLLDGHEIESLAGHVDLSAPIKRDR